MGVVIFTCCCIALAQLSLGYRHPQAREYRDCADDKSAPHEKTNDKSATDQKSDDEKSKKDKDKVQTRPTPKNRKTRRTKPESKEDDDQAEQQAGREAKDATKSNPSV